MSATFTYTDIHLADLVSLLVVNACNAKGSLDFHSLDMAGGLLIAA
jgi:hypothetical protein